MKNHRQCRHWTYCGVGTAAPQQRREGDGMKSTQNEIKMIAFTTHVQINVHTGLIACH
jgi:hypothetical protein